MSSYIYRGVKYSQSNAFVESSHHGTFTYRGVSYTKQAPVPAILDKSKICYRGFRLAGATAPEATRPGAFRGRLAHYEPAH